MSALISRQVVARVSVWLLFKGWLYEGL